MVPARHGIYFVSHMLVPRLCFDGPSSDSFLLINKQTFIGLLESHWISQDLTNFLKVIRIFGSHWKKNLFKIAESNKLRLFLIDVLHYYCYYPGHL